MAHVMGLVTQFDEIGLGYLLSTDIEFVPRSKRE